MPYKVDQLHKIRLSIMTLLNILKNFLLLYIFSKINLVQSKFWLFNRERLFIDISPTFKKHAHASLDTSNRSKTCPPFYYFTGRDIKRGSSRIFMECRRNKCTCFNGEPAIRCNHHNEQKCQRCDQNYHKSGNYCKVNECSCRNGIPAKICQVNQAEICDHCFPGYHKTENANCAQNICECKNGIPKKGNLLLDLTLNIKNII